MPVDGASCPELLDRLWDRDASLWSTDPAVQRTISNRLGWLDAGAFLDEHSGRITAFVERIKSEGYQHAALLGMGGSSLAPEVYAALCGDARDGLALTVADTTCPEQVTAITNECEARPTLFIVSSKSGTTAETSALEAHFFEWARARSDPPGRQFIAITDPGSPLAELAAERGYRDTFLNPADIGGRFSALSFFGLVPAALAGLDPGGLRRHLPDATGDPSLGHDACRLGKALGELARRGSNKLTLQLGAALAPLAPWIEQLIDESTGKDGTGVAVIADEPRLAPQDYSNDRCFIVVDTADRPVDAAWRDSIAAHGRPLAHWRIDSVEKIGAEFFRWEIATAIAGRALGINPFDEPDVNDSKARTRAILEQSTRAEPTAPQPLSAVNELLATARPGDYIAVLAYLPRTPANEGKLGEWRDRLTRRTGLPACIGFGPRYLHSSGQLHKGGPDQGIFIVVTERSSHDIPIPGQQHGFRSLFEAQARGDLQVLRDRGRRVAHLDVDDDAGLEALIQSTP